MSGEHDAALRCVGLQISYGGAPALDDVDLVVHCGELLALLGASGSGKSTLLHAVAGLLTPSAGEIWLAGQQVATPRQNTPPDQRAVGLVFQDFALWPHLSALDTVAYPLRRLGRSRAEARARARILLEQLDIGQLADRRPAELSGGQRQRIGLARALAREPRLFLLDEPTAHLDTHLRAAFQDLVRRRQAETGAAAVYATHDAGEALALADRVALVVAGRLVQIAAPQIVYGEPVSVAAAVLTGPCTILAAPVSSVSPGTLRIDLGGETVEVLGGAGTGPQRHRRRVMLRPDWVEVGGPLAGRITARAFRGPHTDYQLDTCCGTVQMQLPGTPTLPVGEPVGWGIRRAWALPGELPDAHGAHGQPSAVIAPG